MNRRTVLIAGGRGAIGFHLRKLLAEAGYPIKILTRSPEKLSEHEAYFWDTRAGNIDKAAFDGVRAVINLAGENIGSGRWTSLKRKSILESRIDATKLLTDSIAKLSEKPKTFINASAIGIYGTFTSESVLTEESKAGNDFLADVVKAWEKEADKAEGLGMRTVKIRTAVAIDPHAGVLPRFLLPSKFGMLNYFGSGKQYMPWIHVYDLANLYKFAVENESVSGIYNAAAPEHITQKQFAESVKRNIDSPALLAPVPATAAKLMFGKMSSIMLEGTRVSSEKIRNKGFEFKYPDIDAALAAALPEVK